MTNIQAISLLKDLEQSLDDYCELNDEGKTAFHMAITALEVFGNSEQLPFAQPDVPDINVGDMISRQQAISRAVELRMFDRPVKMVAVSELERLPSVQPEQDMVDDLISFIEREKGKENRTLADWTVQWILESIINGECKITGSATDHKEKKMYVEFSFFQEEHDG